MMKVIVTGAAGMLGMDVVKEMSRRGINHIGVDISELDITDHDAVGMFIEEHHPSHIIHCAAYTAVDRAEDEPALCMRVNEGGTENLACACRATHAELLYISTDYVFSGLGSTPHETDTPPMPLSVYGKSKLAGENAVIRHLTQYYIVRTSWVFGPHGRHFAKTMLDLSRTHDTLNVVDDQVGSPTYSPDLAVLLCDMIISGKYGVYHAANDGYCSWADFAREIMRMSHSSCAIQPIPSVLYPAKATRPRNSRLSMTSLDNAGFKRLPDWHNALERYLHQDV
jgi:dTDP-4-dehydrorhamnose reductase